MVGRHQIGGRDGALAGQLRAALPEILPFPTTGQSITTSDANGDVIIVLGPDVPR